MNQDSKSVSIVVPMHNVANYIRKCLDSLISQTLHDIEIICVDDGSSDDSAAIAESYSENDSRIKVIRRAHTNAGATRNAGLDVAKGEYIGFVDSDDWCDETLFQKAYSLAKAHDADVVSWGYREYDAGNGLFGSSRLFSGRRARLASPHAPEDLADDIFNPLAWGPCMRLVRHDFLTRERIRFQDIAYSDDVYICCLEYALAPRQAILNEPLYFYRVNSGGSQQQSNSKHTENILVAWEAVAAELERRGMFESVRLAFARSAINSFFHSLTTISESAAYCRFYKNLRNAVLESRHFSTISECEITNDLSQFMLGLLRRTETPLDFLVQQSRYYEGKFSRTWWELQAAKRRSAGDGRNVGRRRIRLSAALNDFFVSGRLKRLRGIVKQFLPYGFMRRHLVRVYGIAMPERGNTPLARLLWDATPFYLAQDRELMMECESHGKVVQVPSATKLSKSRVSALGKMYVGKDEETVFRELHGKVEFIIQTASYHEVPGVLEGIAAFYQTFASGCNKARLSALLRRLKLLQVLDLLDADPKDKIRQILIDIFNAPPGVLEQRSSLSSQTTPVPASGNPKISFIVPVCNVERYLIRCIESLRHQAEPDIEIICVDDGSKDGSPSLLDRVANADGRIKVVHKQNEGVSAARNLGLKMARGRYVAFVDGDDWVSSELSTRTIRLCDDNALDVCFFDYECFNYKDKRAENHYWTLANRSADWIFGRVFSMRELTRWRYYGSACIQVFRRTFLEKTGVCFPVGIKLSEDAMFMHQILPCVERAMCIRDVLYHYRRGNPRSAVSCLSGESATMAAVEAKRAYLAGLEKLLTDCFMVNFPVFVSAAFAERAYMDLEYHAKLTPAIKGWLQEGHCKELSRMALWWRTVPPDAAHLMQAIELKRANEKHDLYLVAGQIAAPNVDQIDSWQFFRWLQDHHVPSRYIVWRNSSFYEKILRWGALKDVVVMETNCRNDELLHHVDLLARAKAFVVEWQLDKYPDAWFRYLRDMCYVFLQHGVTGCWLTPEHRQTFMHNYNYCNVFSDRERRLIEGDGRGERDSGFFVAGLPRYDLLDGNWQKADKGERTVFVMFTWRQGLNVGGTRLMYSAYWQGLTGLLSAQNQARLSSRGIKLVVAPHHRLLQFVRTLDFGPGVKVVGQDDIAYWIRHADAMVTDFSSASFDFMYQNKPTIYWIPDKDDPLLDHSAHQDGGKVDSALELRKNFYNTVDSIEEVLSLIEYYDDRDFELEPEKRAVARTFFDVRGNISQHVFEQIERIAYGGGKAE